jgi:hypothetical protein
MSLHRKVSRRRWMNSRCLITVNNAPEAMGMKDTIGLEGCGATGIGILVGQHIPWNTPKKTKKNSFRQGSRHRCRYNQ